MNISINSIKHNMQNCFKIIDDDMPWSEHIFYDRLDLKTTCAADMIDRPKILSARSH